MLAWWEELITDVKQKSWLWRHCRRRLLLITPISQTCHAKPKTQSTGAGRYNLAHPLVGCLPASSLAWRLLSEKVRTLWHCSRLGSVALYLWLIVVISVRQSSRCSAILWAYCRSAGYGQFEHKGWRPDCKFKEAGGTVREIDVWAESPRLSPALVICIIICLSLNINHYRDNAITYKEAQRDKNTQRTEAGERGNCWHAG